MGRGAESKLRRRQQRKAAGETEEDIFGDADAAADASLDDGIPLPPKMKKKAAKVPVETASDSDDDVVEDLPKKKNKKAIRQAGAGGGGGGGERGIKTMPLMLLIIMMGTTILPGLIFASDYIGNYLAKNNVLGSIGFRLGIGAVPKRRVLSFYEKHAPEKLTEVPTILAKHYGEYPVLIKKLERKYQDYGYFIGWEEDEAPITLALEKLRDTYNAWITDYWNRYAPQVLKTAARNVRYNLTFLLKKFRRAWKKYIWPTLEPFFGVPKGVEKQKRADAAEAKRRQQEGGKKSQSGARRKNTAFRDDVEEEHH